MNSNRCVKAILIAAMFLVPVASYVGYRVAFAKELRMKEVIQRRFHNTLYDANREWFKAQMLNGWVKANFTDGPPGVPSAYKFTAIAHKYDRCYQAMFSDGLAELVIEASVWKECAGTMALIHYDGRSKKLTCPCPLSDEAEREILQSADELAATIRTVYEWAMTGRGMENYDGEADRPWPDPGPLKAYLVHQGKRGGLGPP